MRRLLPVCSVYLQYCAYVVLGVVLRAVLRYAEVAASLAVVTFAVVATIAVVAHVACVVVAATADCWRPTLIAEGGGVLKTCG